MSVDELRDLIAQAIRGPPLAGEPTWDVLTEERRSSWREDAMRVLDVLEIEEAKHLLRARAALRADFEAGRVERCPEKETLK